MPKVDITLDPQASVHRMETEQRSPLMEELSPHRVEEVGLPLALLEDLVIRRVVHDSRVSMGTLGDRLCLSSSVADTVVRGLRERKLLDFDGLDGRDYVLVPTDAGRKFCADRSQQCRYAGPAPISLEHYVRIVKQQRPVEVMDRARLTRAFSDLVLSDTLIDSVGPAVASEGAIFLYGPPGTGKTSIAERVVRAYGDCVLVPYCVEADGQIISIFDPTMHHRAEGDHSGIDPRFVVCERPAVVTGGELQSSMLDLHFDVDIGIYHAPLQMKANNGVLVIDDFGRQQMTPSALLNRWIIPLDRRVDYLTLAGRKVEVPFELKVVLSTNLDPAALGDDAFFRRIRNKIYIGAITDEQFDWILTRVTRAQGFECEASAATRLRDQARLRGDGELRAYLPSVVVEVAQAVAKFDNLAPVLTAKLVDRVLDLYFTKFEEVAVHPAPAMPSPPVDAPVVQESISQQAQPAPGPVSYVPEPTPSPEPAMVSVGRVAREDTTDPFELARRLLEG